ncbi:helix-turn-helix domain-containing protein [Lactiplantibacillus pentosus]|nr:helix-turn-helix domain-containing protein [Lactiplantibacillus pentosus]MCT3298384.1 helix-turn-helix domain-containing protein [Lactiplantibacillus pentosus]MCT3313407.1 helix-turn-helix domain-containing protein [Lactiplantibacillus pentosus]MCT3329966.1 helix-turn-helix domain-containing protein [Lactiplantibacillus pentosus]
MFTCTVLFGNENGSIIRRRLAMAKVTKKFYYNDELETTAFYTETWRLEKTQVKDISDLLVWHHYWIDSDGELWSDFDDPMENPKADFEAYRTKENYLKPEQIKQFRQNTGLTVQALASYVGMDSSTLSQLENNDRVQTKEQDSLLKGVIDYFQSNSRLP